MPKEDSDTPKRNRGGNRNQPIVSCLECRRMKWRCDRQFPCAHCRRRGLSHLCPGKVPSAAIGATRAGIPSTSDRRLAPTPPSAVTEILTARIAELEAQIEAVRAAISAPRPSTASPAVTRDSEVVEEEAGGKPGDDALLSVDDGGRSTFYGSAATHYLIGREEADMRLVAPFVGGGGGLTDILLGKLPARALGERWLQIYFECASFMNDIVERGRVAAEMDACYTLTPTDNQQAAIVLTILSIGASTDLDLPPYNAEAEKLFMAARAALNIDPSGSMAFVQCITLMSRYLANCTHPYTFGTFWTTLGTAARCAQSLGLHRDGSKWGFDPEVSDLRRRVFWEIQTEDVLQSLTQGRPRCITDATIDARFPTASHDGDRVQTLFNDAKYRLIRIMGQINDQQTTTRPVPYADTMRLHHAIREFECDLAPELKAGYAGPVGGGASFAAWQQLYIRLLVHVSYNFLHHAHFARALRDYPTEPLASPFQFSYVAELDASRAILNIFEDALELSTPVASRFWIFFFDAFTSTINFAGVAMRAPRSSLAPAALSQAERGVALATRLPDGIRGREDLPMLRRVLARAQQAMVQGADGGSDDESSALLRTGHQVVRQSGANVSPKLLQSFSPHANIGLGEDERRLPATLDEAREVAETLPGPELALELDPLIFHVVQDDFGRCVDDELEAFIASIGLAPLKEA
ncbi:hypothetical protein CC85DRAFT_284105 [Cutaneotrichosporon oleaginosum]|uniref:Zn(2)-C6 fungal-type domain-containing protein n=1 Tax=Cutaneotrichosporon oleaginosum TaxID=879819 RepID=A0A0J0XRR8_9TREE|nr:uncharacterized protein CC85DRAFT_284105 [Cutaneotrichosporon oleaginosum]KLT43821.1 hypothetical protein CC85DRAFT_284105 [Cutaneotrichosporon oleaginosum]TXT06437.1 hypothetical protein COLE_05768 [Cutaneotrichosporon oleaginosum]